jgi:Fic family protein
MLSAIDVALPPLIAHLDFSAAPATATLSERAVAEIAYTEGSAGSQLAALGRFLTQTESVSSSKIERVEAGSEDFARALVGIKANPSAVSMVAATEALTRMVDRAGETGRIELTDLLAAHEILTRDDPLDRDYAGRVRDMQNWIGGSDHSPRGAVHIPPPPSCSTGISGISRPTSTVTTCRRSCRPPPRMRNSSPSIRSPMGTVASGVP